MKSSAFLVPVQRRYFEDYVAGTIHEFGTITVEEEEIIAAARRRIPKCQR